MYITLTRKRASVKLKSASAATFFFQRGEGRKYERRVPIEEVILAFDSNPKYRLRIDTSTSDHVIFAVRNLGVKYGYRVEFS